MDLIWKISLVVSPLFLKLQEEEVAETQVAEEAGTALGFTLASLNTLTVRAVVERTRNTLPSKTTHHISSRIRIDLKENDPFEHGSEVSASYVPSQFTSFTGTKVQN